ncbi:cilia- and flagella-associated protein 299 isoform X2 [Narcine bancroftii]|uniref:cilia- and flagella-associated protein 299 isoform X2 n=1 Tax=Narcine bancroftii TaxID=1343680 RepID=UPI0038311243
MLTASDPFSLPCQWETTAALVPPEVPVARRRRRRKSPLLGRSRPNNMEEEEAGAAAVDNIINEFETYESFLDSQITSLDLYYLEDEELARQLVELGYRGSGEVLKREEFEMRKAAAEAARLAKKSQKTILASAGKELKDNFLMALAEREENNRNGKMSVGVPLVPTSVGGVCAFVWLSTEMFVLVHMCEFQEHTQCVRILACRLEHARLQTLLIQSGGKDHSFSRLCAGTLWP